MAFKMCSMKKKMGIEITNVSTPPKGKFIGINTPSQIGVTLKNMDCDVYHGFDPGGAIIASSSLHQICS
jgi:hypothetical protein